MQEDAPRPGPSTQKVLLEVYAAGVNPIDWKVREGYAKGWLRHKQPLVPGWDSGQLMQIARLVDSGDVRPMVEMVMPLAKARRALEMSQAGHVQGKIVLRIKE